MALNSVICAGAVLVVHLIMAQKHVLKFSSIVNYFTDEKKLIERGENAVESGDVLKMNYDDNSKIISGTVRASMKDKIYKVEVCRKSLYLLV